jgi:hypothetical protein
MRIDRVLALATAGLLVGLTGCSGNGGDAADSPAPAGAESSAATSQTPSASVEPEDTSAPSDEPAAAGEGYDADELIDAMQAAFQQNRSAHMTMRATGGQMQMSAEGDVSYAGGQSAMRMTMQAPALGAGRVEMRAIDGVLYMSIPPMTPRGKFVKVDPRDPNSPLAGMDLTGQLDPMHSFDAFRDGLKKVRFVGEESVDGEDMDHYVLTVDTSAVLKSGGQQVAPGMPKTVTYDLWLDRDDLMRRLSFDVAGTGMVLEMSQWGEPVHVTAPPASAIMTMPGMPQM